MEQEKKDNNPLLMPGPQFNQDTSPGWFRQHAQKIVIGVVVALLAIGGYSMYKSYQQKRAALEPILQGIMQESPIASPADENLAAPNTLDQEKTLIAGQVKGTTGATTETAKKDASVTAKAVKGNGATHLARAALKEYLKDKPELQAKLLPEHKIYIEDYLRKHADAPKILHPGDEITFDNTLIDDAIAQAQTLNQNQINNLHQYVLSVPSL